MKKPEPVATGYVCSLCGLPWDDHGEKPTAETCIALLRAELVKRPAITITPYPTVVGDGAWWRHQPISTGATTTSGTLLPFRVQASGTASAVIANLAAKAEQEIGRDDEDPPAGVRVPA